MMVIANARLLVYNDHMHAYMNRTPIVRQFSIIYNTCPIVYSLYTCM